MQLRSGLRGLLPGRSREDRDLGRGVWRRAHDRFRRAVDRYHQVLEGVPDGVLRDDLEVCGARLAACLDAVRATCGEAQAAWPSEALEVPGGGVDLHRRLSRAGTLAAQAAQAAAMARTGPAPAGSSAGAAAVQRAVSQVERLVSGA
ncbi:hypothetical protein [Quadrisphaera sp. DSM 44207]|uniref:hypothetical protein n=1 Tax=Quadrisphaera sp. DSM 44207 TaxID=1881057 RepID=UPI000892544B|nr:hypothetical protein [Quadrisphaera sp. DSM 44207]SDQ20928.1 hypothetical protein SAMN05428996_1092 [Quadrisphaera sp. DSM 44207]